MVPDDRKYTQEHEWILIEGNIGTVESRNNFWFHDIFRRKQLISQKSTGGVWNSVMHMEDIEFEITGNFSHFGRQG